MRYDAAEGDDEENVGGGGEGGVDSRYGEEGPEFFGHVYGCAGRGGGLAPAEARAVVHEGTCVGGNEAGNRYLSDTVLELE